MVPAALIERIPNGYRISFADDAGELPYIVFDVLHVEDSGWGLLATVHVRSPLHGVARLPGGTLLMQRMNLLRTKEQLDMATRIQQLLPGPDSARRIDWQRHIEHVQALVWDELTRPVPIIDLRDRPVPEAQRFAVPGFLPLGKVSILYGPGGAGKSSLCLRLAGSVATGVEFLDLPVLHTGRVLYLDWEDDEDTITHRLHLVTKGMGLQDTFGVGYKSLRGRGPYERHHADILMAVSDMDVQLVIIDSTGMALSGSKLGDGAETVIRFNQQLSELQTTVLLIDHISSDDLKEAKGTPKPYGSVYKMNAARNVWEMAPPDSDLITGFTLRHRKSNVGPRYADIGVYATWTDDYVIYERLYPGDQ